MRYVNDRVIILGRTDFGEKDRILVALGRDHGKVTLIAKSTRSAKSKLAGSIELFCETDIQYVQGKGSIFTLTGARLHKSYSKISDYIENTMIAYEFLKTLKKITEESQGHEYYFVLTEALEALNENNRPHELIKAWFNMRILHESGHLPGLRKDTEGKKLHQANAYDYDFENHCFSMKDSGKYSSNDIKLLRLLAGSKNVPNAKPDNNSLNSTSQLVEQLVQLQLY